MPCAGAGMLSFKASLLMLCGTGLGISTTAIILPSPTLRLPRGPTTRSGTLCMAWSKQGSDWKPVPHATLCTPLQHVCIPSESTMSCLRTTSCGMRCRPGPCLLISRRATLPSLQPSRSNARPAYPTCVRYDMAIIPQSIGQALPAAGPPCKRHDALYVQRVPSYCDRIVWHSLPALRDRVTCLEYNAVPDIETSDHKPVYATFDLEYGCGSCPNLSVFFATNLLRVLVAMTAVCKAINLTTMTPTPACGMRC